jgi:hypothetical protein
MATDLAVIESYVRDRAKVILGVVPHLGMEGAVDLAIDEVIAKVLGSTPCIEHRRAR